MAAKPPLRKTNKPGSPSFIVCTPKRLPREMIVEAAEHARRLNPLNFAPVHRLSRVMPEFAADKQRLAAVTTKYWGIKGVKLSVSFLDGQSPALRRLTLEHMNAWSKSANVQFVESEDRLSADVRIHRLTGREGGYWSYLGTDIRLIKPGQPTMNLEGFTESHPESEFRRVVRHETGHTLGFAHEHLRKALVDLIDRQKAYKYFFRTQGWSRQEVDQQVLTPLEEGSLIGTVHPDPFSIMCYQIPAEITVNGEPIVGGKDIDAEDEEFAARIYPKSVEPHASEERPKLPTRINSSATDTGDLLQQYLQMQKQQNENMAALIALTWSSKAADDKGGGPRRPCEPFGSRSADGKIDLPETVVRTKKMVAYDTGRDEDDIYTSQDLEEDLGYTVSNKKNLERPIEQRFFADVEAQADPDDLARATTVGDLSFRIFNKYIPEPRRRISPQPRPLSL